MKQHFEQQPLDLKSTFALSLLLVGFGAAACAGKSRSLEVTPVPVVKATTEYLAEGQKAVAEGRFEAAIDALNVVLEREPTWHHVRYNRAFAYQELGQLELATADYAAVLEAEPQAIDAALNLGALYKDQGQIRLAMKVTLQALRSDEFNPSLLNNLAVLQRESGAYKSSIASIRKLLQRDKNNIAAYKNLSLVYFEQKKFQLAKTILENALKKANAQGKQDPDIHINLGMIYLALDQQDLAMVAFKRAQAMRGDHPTANFNIGSLALQNRDYDLAAESYSRIAEVWSDNIDVLTGYGYALQGQGKLGPAAEKLEAARRLMATAPSKTSDEDRTLLEQLVVIYQAAEQSEKALAYADEYIKVTGLSCGDEDYEGFCGRYNGIKLMIQMAAEEVPKTTSDADDKSSPTASTSTLQ